MQLTNAFCYILLTVTMATTCIEAGSEINDVENKKLDKRMSRRSSTVVVDTASAVERMYQTKPNVMYRKFSKKRHVSPAGTYGPRRTKYGTSRLPRKPAKKYRSKSNQKFNPSTSKKRSPKPRYGVPKRQSMKPVYGPPKQALHRLRDYSGFGELPKSFPNAKSQPKLNEFSRPQYDDYSSSTANFGINSRPEFVDDFTSRPGISHPMLSSPAGFREDFSNKPYDNGFAIKPPFGDFRNPMQEYEDPPMDSYAFKQGYGEPPVDSYGAPIQPNLHDLTMASAQQFSALNHEDFNFGRDPRPMIDFRDEKSEHSNVYRQFTKPDSEIFVTPVPNKQKEEQNLKSYSDIYDFRQIHKKKKASYHDGVKLVNQPWKGAKLKDEPDEEIVVGGQYAEPPARYVSKFQANAQMFKDDNVFSPQLDFSENDEASPSISSYVNYKNSNMAFSPQNLNDVFSITDK